MITKNRTLNSLIVAAVVATMWQPAHGQSNADSDGASARYAAALTKLQPSERKLAERAKSILLGNIVLSNAWKSHRGIEPSASHYQGVWNWDAAFHAVGVSLWDSQLAREQIEILFDHQQTNGMLPDVIWQTGGMVTTCTKPPVMGWAIAVVDHRSPDDGFLRKIYPKLIKLGEFWLKERGGEKDGLFFYAGSDVGFDSGWDDSIRWDGGYRHSSTDEKRLWAIDLNCYMVSHYRALSYIAGRLGLPDDQKKWANDADALARRINNKLWDDQLGAYVDRDRITGANGPALSSAAFMPLFVHIAPPDRAARLVKLAAEPQKFYPGMPSAAYDTPGFDPNGMWRGPAWLNTSFFAFKGLKDYGASPLAAEMRATLLGWVAKDETMHEYYQSKTGEGIGAKDYGWSAVFTLAFLLDWDNDDLTWLFQPVPKQAP